MSSSPILSCAYSWHAAIIREHFSTMISSSVGLSTARLPKNRLFMLGFIPLLPNSNGCCPTSLVSPLEFSLDADVLRTMTATKAMTMEMIEYIFIFLLWLKFIKKYIDLKNNNIIILWTYKYTHLKSLWIEINAWNFQSF